MAVGNNKVRQKRNVGRAFKMKGLSIQASALDFIVNAMSNEPKNMYDSTLNNILDEIKERMMKGATANTSTVTTKLVSAVLNDLRSDAGDTSNEILQVLDSTSTPRLTYNSLKKRFHLLKNENKSFLGQAHHKVDMLLQRYIMVEQRMLRQDHFRSRLVTADGHNRDETQKITPIEGLAGQSGTRVLLGIIVQVEEGKIYLEDPSAQVPIDLSETQLLSNGFITENSIVLVEGEMVDGVFRCNRMGHPIFEPRAQALDAVGLQSSDIFNAIPTLSELSRLKEQENRHGSDGMFVILSDVHLDDSRVLSKLEVLFSGYNDYTPLPVFVLMGNFSSQYSFVSGSECGNSNAAMIGYFEDLANIISKFPNIAREGRFVFIPGENDPGLGRQILPRPAIPSFFTGPLRSKVNNIYFATNPCRIRYYSKEIVLGRVDILSKLRQACILPPNEIQDTCTDDDAYKSKHQMQHLINHGVKTMLDQGHMLPVPLSECPIYWQHDHALRLYPPPDALIMGDCSADKNVTKYGGCDTMNPGQFHMDFSFLAYKPFDTVQEDRTVQSAAEIIEI